MDGASGTGPRPVPVHLIVRPAGCRRVFLLAVSLTAAFAARWASTGGDRLVTASAATVRRTGSPGRHCRRDRAGGWRGWGRDGINGSLGQPWRQPVLRLLDRQERSAGRRGSSGGSPAPHRAARIGVAQQRHRTPGRLLRHPSLGIRARAPSWSVGGADQDVGRGCLIGRPAPPLVCAEPLAHRADLAPT